MDSNVFSRKSKIEIADLWNNKKNHIERQEVNDILQIVGEAIEQRCDNRSILIPIYGAGGVGKSTITDKVYEYASEHKKLKTIRIDLDNKSKNVLTSHSLSLTNIIVDGLKKFDDTVFNDYIFVRYIYQTKFDITDDSIVLKENLISEGFDTFISDALSAVFPWTGSLLNLLKKIKNEAFEDTVLKSLFEKYGDSKQQDFIKVLPALYLDAMQKFTAKYGPVFIILDNAEDIYKEMSDAEFNEIIYEQESTIWFFSGRDEFRIEDNNNNILTVRDSVEIKGFKEKQIIDFFKKCDVFIDGKEISENIAHVLYEKTEGNILWLKACIESILKEQNVLNRYLGEKEFFDIINKPKESLFNRIFDTDFKIFTDKEKTYILYSCIPEARSDYYDAIVSHCNKLERQEYAENPWYIKEKDGYWMVYPVFVELLQAHIKNKLNNIVVLKSYVDELKYATKKLLEEKMDEDAACIAGNFYSTFCTYDEICELIKELNLVDDDSFTDLNKWIVYRTFNKCCLENCSDIRFLTNLNRINIRDYKIPIEFCKRAISSFNEFDNDEIIKTKLWPIYAGVAKIMKFDIKLNTETNIKYCHDTFKYIDDKTYEIIKEFEKLDKAYSINKCLFEISYSYSRILENKTKTVDSIKKIITDDFIKEFFEAADYYIEKYADNDIVCEKLCGNKIRFLSEFYGLFDNGDEAIEADANSLLEKYEDKYGKNSIEYAKALNNNHRIYKNLGLKLNSMVYFERSGEYICEALSICIDALSKKERLSNHDKKIIDQIFDNISHYFSDVSISTKTNEMISNIENTIFSSYDFLINSFYNVSDLVTTIIDYYVDNHMYFQLFSFVNKVFEIYCGGNDYRVLANITKNNYSYFSDLLYETQLKTELNDAIRLSESDDQEKNEKNTIKVKEFKKFITLGMKFFTESHFENEFMFKECRFIFFDLVENFEMIDSKEYKNEYIEDVSSCDIIKKYWYRLNQNNPKYLQWRDFERDAYQYMCYKCVYTYNKKKGSIEKESAQKLRNANFNQLKILIKENILKVNNPKNEVFSEALMYSRKIINYDMFMVLYMSYIDLITNNSFKKDAVLDVKDLAQLFTSSISWKNYNYDTKLIGVDSDARFGHDNNEFKFRVLDASKLVMNFEKRLASRYKNSRITFNSYEFVENVIKKLFGNFEYYIGVFDGKFNPFLLRYRAMLLELEIELPSAIFKPESHFKYIDEKIEKNEINENYSGKQFWIKYFGISSDVNANNENRIEIMKCLEKALTIFSNASIKSAIYWNMFKVYTLIENFDYNKAIEYGQESIKALIESSEIIKELISKRLYEIINLYKPPYGAMKFLNEVKNSLSKDDSNEMQEVLLEIESIMGDLQDE